MSKALHTLLAILWLAGVVLFPLEAFAEPSPKKKAPDNQAVLDVLPGPGDSLGIRPVIKEFGLTFTRIVIDHQTPQDPINVLVRFELPRMKSCPLGAPPDHPSEVEATWQSAPGSDGFLPMNVWARNLSRGKIDVFLAAACSNP
ncbi:MAG: hypothetical protein M1537_05355 [Nitrospirae bacterium]|nr:hypothetical protein [Nitrospirota bacterium]MCL5284835.1 hypothetical protein [Nitrospirota bacterium]